MQDSGWNGEDRRVDSERIRNTARVVLLYGVVRRIGEKKIIPVAAVAYTFGGGGGGGTATPSTNGHGEETSIGGGGGGGGSVRVQPVGVLEITEDETHLVPVLDWSRIITTALTVFGIWMVFRTIFRRR
jgi:uncharacterized spore protein YtfJ